MTTKQPIDRFNASIVEIINSFNLLDHNLGLSLAHLVSPGSFTEAYSKIFNMSVKTKITNLTKKLRSHPEYRHIVDQQEYIAWCSSTEKTRYNRNLHGVWAFKVTYSSGRLDFPFYSDTKTIPQAVRQAKWLS